MKEEEKPAPVKLPEAVMQDLEHSLSDLERTSGLVAVVEQQQERIDVLEASLEALAGAVPVLFAQVVAGQETRIAALEASLLAQQAGIVTMDETIVELRSLLGKLTLKVFPPRKRPGYGGKN